MEAWCSSALDFEVVLSGLNESPVHVFVADVIECFDTVDRGVLDFVHGRLGLPVWFRRTYFGYHAFDSGLSWPVVSVRPGLYSPGMPA